MAQKTQRPEEAGFEELDIASFEIFKKRKSANEVRNTLKNRTPVWCIAVNNIWYKLPSNGVKDLLNRVRGLAMDRETGKVAEWFEPAQSDPTDTF